MLEETNKEKKKLRSNQILFLLVVDYKKLNKRVYFKTNWIFSGKKIMDLYFHN